MKKTLFIVLTTLWVVAVSIGSSYLFIRKAPDFGATIPIVVANFTTSLNSSISSSDTSMTLVTGTDASGDSLSGYICFTIDEGTSSEEHTCGTASGTSVTAMLRGIDPIDGDLEVTALKKAHRRGASVKITDFPILGVLARLANGTESFPNRLEYATHPSFSGTAASKSFVTKKYVDDTNNTGAADATTTLQGLVEIATSAEIIAGTATGGTGASLVMTPDFVIASSSANKIIRTGSSGYIDSTFINIDSATLEATGNNLFGVKNVSSSSFSDALDKIIRSDGDAVPSGLWIDITRLNITSSASGDMIIHNGTNYTRLAYPTITSGATFDLVASVSGGSPRWNDGKNDFASGHGSTSTTESLVAASVSFTPNWMQLHYSCDGANASPSGSAVYLRKDASVVGINAIGEGNDGTGAGCSISSGNGIAFTFSISTDGDSVYLSATESGTSQTTVFYWFAGR